MDPGATGDVTGGPTGEMAFATVAAEPVDLTCDTFATIAPEVEEPTGVAFTAVTVEAGGVVFAAVSVEAVGVVFAAVTVEAGGVVFAAVATEPLESCGAFPPPWPPDPKPEIRGIMFPTKTRIRRKKRV
jgi:hypothetical protein